MTPRRGHKPAPPTGPPTGPPPMPPPGRQTLITEQSPKCLSCAMTHGDLVLALVHASAKLEREERNGYEASPSDALHYLLDELAEPKP